MAKEDPYYTWTDYSLCKPVAHKICWIVPLLVLAAVGALIGAAYFGAELLALLGG